MFNCQAHICTFTPFPLAVPSGRFCLPVTSLLIFIPGVMYRDLENGMVLIVTGSLNKYLFWDAIGTHQMHPEAFLKFALLPVPSTASFFE